jgi:hypothetical protein
MGLLAIPGTATGGAQARLNSDQILKKFADSLVGRFCGAVRRFAKVSARRLRRSLLDRL